MNFKLGQSVVYIGDDYEDGESNVPSKNVIITIHSRCKEFNDCYVICEYKFTHSGEYQSIKSTALRPLDRTFGAEVEEKLKKELFKVKEL